MPKRKMIGQGRTAEVYLWNSDKILKLFRDWAPVEWVESEARVGRAVYNAGMPAPELFDIIQDDGRTGLIYERIDGVSLLKIISTKPWRISGYARQMARLHFKIHQSGSDKLPTGNDKIIYAIKNAESILGEKTNQIITYLNNLPGGDKICHGDFHPDNILISTTEWVAIDWMTAYVGNPLSDVARSCLMMHSPYIPPDTPKLLVKILKSIISWSYLNEYLKLANVRWEDIEIWMLPVAAARICENVPGEEKWLLEMIKNGLKQI